LAMAKRRNELDFRNYWWFCTVCIWDNTNFSTIPFPPYLRSVWRSLYHYGNSWGWIFERIVPDVFDVIGAIIAIVGVIVIFYMPRKGSGEKLLWSRQQ
jgi:hypothetical protein